MKTVGLLFCLIISNVVNAKDCLTGPELLELNKSIACQQMQNPVDCHDFSEYLDYRWAKDDLRDEKKYDDVNSHFVALSAITALVATVSNPRVRAFIALGEKIDRVENALSEVKNSKTMNTKSAQVMKAAIQSLLSSKLLQSLGRVPGNLSQSQIGQFTKDLLEKVRTNPGAQATGRFGIASGKIALTGLQRLGAWPLTAGLLLYELDAYFVEKSEEKSGCKAKNRNSIPYACFKEDCWFHHTTCSKSFNFIATMPPKKQSKALNEDDRFCEYMTEHFEITKHRRDKIELISCSEDGKAKYKINSYNPPDLKVSGDSKWTPPAGSAGFDILVATSFEGDLRSPRETVVQISPGIKHYLYNMEALRYRYDQQADLSDVSMNVAGGVYKDTSGVVRSIRWVPPRNRNQIEKIISPADNTGVFASLVQGGWNAESRWIYEQQYLLHKRLSQAHSEVMNCCPDTGSCKLGSDESIPGRPKPANETGS